MVKERIEWIDVSKGIGILLVIIGHCVYFGKFVHNWIFSFHMPLFFILSGIFFQENTLQNFFCKKARQLIFPYVIFCIIGIIITLIIPQWRYITFADILKDLYLGYPDSINVSSVWFLICLFITMLMLNIILYIQKRNITIGYIILLFVVFYGFTLGRFPIVLSIFPFNRMPLNSDSACVALLFLWTGYHFKSQIMNIIELFNSKNLLQKVVFIIIILFATIILILKNGTVNLHGITFNNEIFYITASIMGFIFVIFLSQLLISYKIIANCLKWLGVNSLKIMGTQAIIIRLFLLIINKLTNQHYSLYFLPPIYAIIGSILVSLVTITIVIGYNYVISISNNMLKKSYIQ